MIPNIQYFQQYMPAHPSAHQPTYASSQYPSAYAPAYAQSQYAQPQYQNASFLDILEENNRMIEYVQRQSQPTYMPESFTQAPFTQMPFTQTSLPPFAQIPTYLSAPTSFTPTYVPSTPVAPTYLPTSFTPTYVPSIPVASVPFTQMHPTASFTQVHPTTVGSKRSFTESEPGEIDSEVADVINSATTTTSKYKLSKQHKYDDVKTLGNLLNIIKVISNKGEILKRFEIKWSSTLLPKLLQIKRDGGFVNDDCLLKITAQVLIFNTVVFQKYLQENQTNIFIINIRYDTHGNVIGENLSKGIQCFITKCNEIQSHKDNGIKIVTIDVRKKRSLITTQIIFQKHLSEQQLKQFKVLINNVAVDEKVVKL